MLILGVFSLEGNPLLYMRELYYGCVLFWETRLWESEQEVTVDEIKKDWKIVDVAQIGWTTYICVSVLFVFFYILFPHLFYCFVILFFNIEHIKVNDNKVVDSITRKLHITTINIYTIDLRVKVQEAITNDIFLLQV